MKPSLLKQQGSILKHTTILLIQLKKIRNLRVGREFILQKKSDVKFDPLVGTYYGRWTSRKKYENAQLPKEMYDELVLQCKIASTDISIYHAKPTDKDFISYLKTSELYLWKYSQAARDFLKMVRISDSNKSETRNGIKLAELHLNLFEAFLLKMMMRCPLLIPFFYHAGLKKVTQLLAQKNYFNSAGLVIFCTPRSEIFETSLINTGRTSMRAWLYLNANGYAGLSYIVCNLRFSRSEAIGVIFA